MTENINSIGAKPIGPNQLNINRGPSISKIQLIRSLQATYRIMAPMLEKRGVPDHD
jgi:hypothetical protein